MIANLTLCCPACNQALVEKNASTLNCNNCNKSYPIIDNIPILINDEKSVFSIASYSSATGSSNTQKATGGLKWAVLKFIGTLQRMPPGISLNLKAKKNFTAFAKLLLQKTETPKVLVIGGRTFGEGMEAIAHLPITFIETDVAFGPNTKIICDAHNLPFADNSFDGVIIQAVLEYVVDPYQCVAEIHRVLKSDMPVYAETPFIQQVHGREYDFTRFTHMGFRRLFRDFEEIESGACLGTGSALAWSYKYFILSFSDKKIIRELLLLIANWTVFWFKYFDYLTINKAATLDAASGYYFLGTKSNKTLSDKDLLKQYRGML